MKIQEFDSVVGDYTLRPMKAEDWGRFREMEKTAFEEKDLMREDHFHNMLDTDGFIALETGDLLIGYFRVFRFGSEEGHLGRIAVAGSHLRQGWGKILMEQVIDWFKNQEGIKTVHLYTQDYNVASQSLYRLYGFEVSGKTWSYVIPFAGIEPKGGFVCQTVEDDDIDVVAEMFPSLPSAQIRKFLEDDRQDVITLKDGNRNIVGAARFTPSFPGCFPFEITAIEGFDDFIAGIQEMTPPEFDRMRCTFTDNDELAKVCEERGYELHHRLYKMSCDL